MMIDDKNLEKVNGGDGGSGIVIYVGGCKKFVSKTSVGATPYCSNCLYFQYDTELDEGICQIGEDTELHDQ